MRWSSSRIVVMIWFQQKQFSLKRLCIAKKGEAHARCRSRYSKDSRKISRKVFGSVGRRGGRSDPNGGGEVMFRGERVTFACVLKNTTPFKSSGAIYI